MKGDPKPVWTANRHKWLKTLAGVASAAPASKGQSIVAFSTRTLGWTRFVKGWGDREELTDAGREVLAAWEAADHHPSMKAPTFDEAVAAVLADGGISRLVRWLFDHGKMGSLVTAVLDVVPNAARHATGGVICGERMHLVGDLTGCVLHGSLELAPVAGVPTEEVAERVAMKDLVAAQRPVIHVDDVVLHPPRLKRPASGTAAPEFVRSIIDKQLMDCPRCHGSGKAGHFDCRRCGGSGVIERGDTPL